MASRLSFIASRVAVVLLVCGAAPLVHAVDTAPAAATAPSTAPASAAPSPSLSPDIAALIKDLQSTDWHQSKRAAAALATRGAEVRPTLRQLIDANADLDTVTRAQAVLAQIEENEHIGPSYITLHVKDADARTVMAEIEKQAFCHLKTFPDQLWDDKSIPKVTLDVDHEPFWTVMRRVGEQAGLSLRPFGDQARLSRGVDPGFANGIISGPFLFVPIQLSRIETVLLGPNGQRSSNFGIQINTFAEPKMVNQGATLQIDEAVDDNGNSLVMPADNRFPGGGFMGNGYFGNLRLHWPANPGKKIKRLALTATFNIQTRSQKLQIEQLTTAKPQTFVLAGQPVDFQGCARAGEVWEVKVALSTNASVLQQTLQTHAEVLDANGRELQLRGTTARGNDTTFTYTLQFARQGAEGAVGEPNKLVWEAPVETKQVPVHCTLTDLPMPD